MDTSSIITGTTLNRYQLDIPSCTASLDVEEFSGAEKLSELYYYTITFTSAEKILMPHSFEQTRHADDGRRRTAAVGGLQTRPWRGDCLPAYQQFRRSVDLSDNSPAVSLPAG